MTPSARLDALRFKVSASPRRRPGWRERLRAWWKRFVQNHIIADDPYDGGGRL